VMRGVKRVCVAIDGGATPVVQLKAIISSGATARGYTQQEYTVDSSGDVSLCYKLEKT
jgi:hypothetical protein